MTFLKEKKGQNAFSGVFSFLFFSCILKMALNDENDERRSHLSAGDIRNNSFYDIGKASAHTLDRMVYGPMLTQRFSCFAGPQPGLCIWRFLLYSNNRVSCPSATKLPKGIGFLSMLAGLSQKSSSSEELFYFFLFFAYYR